MENKKFYVSFGQKHPLRNGWVEVEAPDYASARDAVFNIFGMKFAFIRETDDMARAKDFFPAGQFGETIIVESTYVSK